MIIGIGTDIIEIDRIQEAVNRSNRFISKNFTQLEIEMFESRGNKAQTIAANFAAKEAVLKVFGTGLRGCQFSDIEVLRDPLGKPYVVLYKGAKDIGESLGIETIHLSVSHSKSSALAYAIGTGRE